MPTKAKTKSKKSSSTRKRKSSKKSTPFWTKSRISNSLGLLCLFLAVILALSFISYLYTWKADQSKILNLSWSTLWDADISVKNVMGRFGSMASHLFFYKWFGIASFMAPLLLALGGVKLLTTNFRINYGRAVVYGIFIMLWVSVLLAFIFHTDLFAYGGGFGNSIIAWLTSFIGRIGSGFFLLLALGIAAVLTYEIDLSLPRLNFPAFSLPSFNRTKSPVDYSEFDSIGVDGKRTSKLSIDNEVQLDVTPKKAIETDESELAILDDVHKDIDSKAVEFKIEDGKIVEKPLSIPKDIKKTETPEPEALELQIEETKEEEITEEEKAKEPEVPMNYGIGTSYDPTLDLSEYQFPTIGLLEDHGSDNVKIDQAELERNKDQIIETLSNYNIKISKIKATIGPTVTLYEIVPAAGVRISKIKNLEDDIALSLAALGIRIIAPMPGKGTIGIEVPNVKKETVSMKAVISSPKFQNANMSLPIALGKNIANEVLVTDLAKMPHLLIAGATGQGKSVGLNAILVSLLYKRHPSELKFVLIDPKKVELSIFTEIEKHFLAKLPNEEDPIITDTSKVITTLNALCIEMDDRYNLLKSAKARNINEYNKKFIARKLNPEKGFRYLPYIVLVIDEFADLMMTAGKEVERPIARLAQLARAIGIHLIIATQRPSVNIITGTIKANFPARIAFKVSSKVDSRTILDAGGAEQLIGRGDMLLSLGSDMVRLQCAFVDTPEVERIAEYIGEQRGYPEAFLLPEYLTDEEMAAKGEFNARDVDDLFPDAARLIVTHQQGSTSLIQRRMKLGYNRAGRIMDQLEAAGIVGPNEGSKARQVLYDNPQELEQFLDNLIKSN